MKNKADFIGRDSNSKSDNNSNNNIKITKIIEFATMITLFKQIL